MAIAISTRARREEGGVIVTVAGAAARVGALFDVAAPADFAAVSTTAAREDVFPVVRWRPELWSRTSEQLRRLRPPPSGFHTYVLQPTPA